MNLERVANLASSFLNGVNQTSSPSAQPVNLPGLTRHADMLSMAWLHKVGDIVKNVATFIEEAVSLGAIARSSPRLQSQPTGSSQFYTTTHSPPDLKQPIGLRFDLPPGGADDEGYRLGAVCLNGSDQAPSWLCPTGSSPPSSSFAIKPPGLPGQGGLPFQLSTPRSSASRRPLPPTPELLSAQVRGVPAALSRSVVPRPPKPSSEAAVGSHVDETRGAFNLTRKNRVTRAVSRSNSANGVFPTPPRPPLRSNTAEGYPIPQTNRVLSLSGNRKERANAEGFLKSLTESVGISSSKIVSWANLDKEIRDIYKVGGQWQYEAEVTQQLTSAGTSGNLADILKAHSMQVVSNDGDANNCFLISVIQHVNNNYGPVDKNFLNHYREILNSLPGDESIAHNSKMSAESAAAKRFVHLINLDADPKLDIHIISEVDGAMYINRLGGMEDVSDARKVFILDKGGHFEAITNAPQ